MQNYNAKQLKEMSEEALQSLANELRDELRQWRFKIVQGEGKQVHNIGQIRKALARVMTILNQKQAELTKADESA